MGITGANGKSTTTALTAHLLDAGRGATGIGRVWLGGNIGNRPLLTELDRIAAGDVVVLELSSFQLEQLARIRRAPDISVITNLTPNHLDRHGTFECVLRAKETSGTSGLTRRPAVSVSMRKMRSRRSGSTGTRVKADALCQVSPCGRAVRSWSGSNCRARRTCPTWRRRWRWRQLGIGDEIVKDCVGAFKGLEHRLEFVARVRGVDWYNDSIATTPPSAIVALEAFEAPKVIIAGGYDKKLPFDEFGQKIAEKAEAAILIGSTAEKIAVAIEAAPPGRGPAEGTVCRGYAGGGQQGRRYRQAGQCCAHEPGVRQLRHVHQLPPPRRCFAGCVRSLPS